MQVSSYFPGTIFHAWNVENDIQANRIPTFKVQVVYTLKISVISSVFRAPFLADRFNTSGVECGPFRATFLADKVIIPIIEELAFRYFLQGKILPWIAKKLNCDILKKPRYKIFIAHFLFSILHTIPQKRILSHRLLFPTYSIVFEVTRSTKMAIISHAAWNIFAVCLLAGEKYFKCP